MARKPLQITHVKTFVIEGVGSGGDYHNVKPGSVFSARDSRAKKVRSKEAIGSSTAQYQPPCQVGTSIELHVQAGASTCSAPSVWR